LLILLTAVGQREAGSGG